MRPIKLSHENMARLVGDAMKELENCNITDSSVDIKLKLTEKPKDKIQIHFTPEAYLKSKALVENFSTEVAWHMMVHKNSDADYLVYDVLVYPHTVAGATVETDEAEFDEWTDWVIESLDGAPYELFGWSHSHVDFAVNPSPTDIETWKKMATQDANLKFYLFQIWNKKGAINSFLYDMENNTLYTSEDIDIVVDFENDTLDEFVEDAKSMVKEKVVKPTAVNVYGKTVPVSSYPVNSYSKYYDDDGWRSYKHWNSPCLGCRMNCSEDERETAEELGVCPYGES